MIEFSVGLATIFVPVFLSMVLARKFSGCGRILGWMPCKGKGTEDFHVLTFPVFTRPSRR